MMTPNPDTNKENLCFISIVFPVTDDEQIIAVKKKIKEAVSELPQVKTELRITEICNNGSISGRL